MRFKCTKIDTYCLIAFRDFIFRAPSNVSQYKKSHVNVAIQAMFESSKDVCRVVYDSSHDLDHGLVLDLQCKNPKCSHFRNVHANSSFCCSLCEDNFLNPDILGHVTQGKMKCTKYIRTFQDLKTAVLATEGAYFNDAIAFIEDHPRI